MFSKGLIDAYLLESAQAKYPRILISEDLMQLASTQVDTSCFSTLTEEDSLVFVDYLTCSEEHERLALETAVRKIYDNSSDNSSVQEKLRWLAHYADYKLDSKIAGPRFS